MQTDKSEMPKWIKAVAAKLETANADVGRSYDNRPDAEETAQIIYAGWQAHAESVAPKRCKHGVWAADHCYKCEAESLSGAAPFMKCESNSTIPNAESHVDRLVSKHEEGADSQRLSKSQSTHVVSAPAILAREEGAQAQPIWFHGTSPENAERIRIDGFLEGTWFSRHMEDAVKFGGPCVLFVKVQFDETPMGWQACASNAIPASAIVDCQQVRKTARATVSVDRAESAGPNVDPAGTGDQLNKPLIDALQEIWNYTDCGCHCDDENCCALQDDVKCAGCTAKRGIMAYNSLRASLGGTGDAPGKEKA